MIFYDVIQNSEEWDALRLGKFTASEFGNLFMGKETKGYQDSIIKVAYEKVTGYSEEKFSSKFMQRGHDQETLAREAYELLTFETLENGGFYEYDEFTGASPDAKIQGKNGGSELKRPSFRIYNEYLLSQKLPSIYYWQIHGQMLCTGWDFVDFMPFSHPNLKQVLIRVERDEKVLSLLKEQLLISIEEVKKLIEIIKQ
jgi:hypothetical protein